MEDAVALKVKLRFRFFAAVLSNEEIEDKLGHEDEVDTFSESILNLVILPLKFERLLDNLILFSGLEKFFKGNLTRETAVNSAEIN